MNILKWHQIWGRVLDYFRTCGSLVLTWVGHDTFTAKTWKSLCLHRLLWGYTGLKSASTPLSVNLWSLCPAPCTPGHTQSAMIQHVFHHLSDRTSCVTALFDVWPDAQHAWKFPPIESRATAFFCTMRLITDRPFNLVSQHAKKKKILSSKHDTTMQTHSLSKQVCDSFVDAVNEI